MPNPVKRPAYEGVTWETLRTALTAIYWWREGMTDDQWLANSKYVIPMQHNWTNPINATSNDTYIQFWIDRDDRLTQDYYDKEREETLKVADITLRFIGRQGMQWAKAFHHLTKRNSVAGIFHDFCNAEQLEYIGPIVPVNVDYFKVGNTAIGHDIAFSLQYREYMDLSDLHKPLEYISVADGTISGGIPQEVLT